MNITAEEIEQFSREMGVKEVLFLETGFWHKNEESGKGVSPSGVWPKAKTVIILAVPDISVEALPEAGEFGYWDVRNGILDTAAYRLSLLLNSRNYPSVNIPADSEGVWVTDIKPVPVFDHALAAKKAGFSVDKSADGLPRRFASVFTLWEKDKGAAS